LVGFLLVEIKFLPIVTFCIAVMWPAVAPAAPDAAVRAACAGDARRLCGSVFADAPARRACMREHRAEWSDGCKAAVAKQNGQAGEKQPDGPRSKAGRAGGGGCATVFNGKCHSAAWLRHRERCAKFVSDYYRYRPGEHLVTGHNAMRRCTRGGPMYERARVR